MLARYPKAIKPIHIIFMIAAQRDVEHDRHSVVLGEENTLIETSQQVGVCLMESCLVTVNSVVS
tara:strand:+ start:1106 stop:1297 length:192 start_codon:yes stop_codon:yes gene_type:complete